MHATAQHATTPDAPASWLAVGALAASSFALVTTEFLPVGMLPKIAADLAISQGQAGMSVTIPGFVAALAAPLGIAFAGNVDRRKLLALLLALLAASNILVAAAQDAVTFMAGRVLLGIAVGGFWTFAGALGNRLRPGAQGVRANALVLAGVSLGTVAGVPAGALVGELLDWRLAFATAAVLGIVSLVTLLRLLPALPPQAGSGLADMKSLVTGAGSRIALVAALLIFIGQFAAYTYIAPFLHELVGIDGRSLSLVLLVYGMAGFLGNLAGGALAARDPRRTTLFMASMVGAAMLLLPAVRVWPPVVVVLIAVWGFGFGMLPISMQSYLFASAPGRTQAMQAVFVSVGQTAIGGGALLGGLLVDHLSIPAAFYTGGAAALATWLIIAWQGKRQSAVSRKPVPPCYPLEKGLNGEGIE
ncbi:MFS transporter [Massilia dura]|uniref:MFS transporter n=1 Tax=Pseudoduganella dura TaxID=321982 RepID=A0A6I3XKE6_9BURK|nr:MFS transporter [Pseudoduganella dura]MUI14111.1 MFS transporter [Pseudoduganella dura]GGX77038.1 MFS transporter [Pseudoduganella dura]